MKFILLIKVKMPTVGILTFISRIKYIMRGLKQEMALFLVFQFLIPVEISCSLEFSVKKVL